ncbi:OmpA family protein [Campylobacter sp. RM16704]|uniref:OmpA family protein n=1 Tax=Campylobacter sp. RM16704 TaxID=1500960 RepID=UPI0005821DE4|nr:OmpA family protein [Campylobacter sp. RM16704]AJC86153.1 putative protein (OmpA/MotB domain) [Campylobacter sp. RM16704]
MKSIVAFSIALVVLIGVSIGFYMWYFDDNSNTYVYDYKKNNSYNNYTSSSNQYSQENNSVSNNTYEANKIEQERLVENNSILDNNTSTIDTQESISTTQTNAFSSLEKETVSLDQAKHINKKQEKKYKNTMQEYTAKGKTSRYEPRLSNDFIKVYVLNGKSLSDYRITILKEMINPIKVNSQDYNLTIFINMLSNDNMKLSIYNKDIVFAKNKKKYNYVDVKISDLKFLFERNGYSEYSNENLLEKINQNLAREDILKRVKIQGYADDRGSTFANYMIGLNRAMNVAKHFFSFTEVIEIESLGKDTYPTKDKSDSQRQNNRKVEISFL